MLKNAHSVEHVANDQRAHSPLRQFTAGASRDALAVADFVSIFIPSL